MTIDNKQYTDWKRSYDNNVDPNKKVGIHFCNTFGVVGDAALWHADDKYALKHIWKHYVKL
jgi:hypothetical protein